MRKIILIVVCILTALAIPGYYLLYFQFKPLFTKTLEYRVFVNPNTIWTKDTINIEANMKKGVLKDDTMVVLTKDFMLLIIGQYCKRDNDTIILPCDGYLGIQYEVLENPTYTLSDQDIMIGRSKFVRNDKAKFEWWDDCVDQITRLGKGVAIVSGP